MGDWKRLALLEPDELEAAWKRSFRRVEKHYKKKTRRTASIVALVAFGLGVLAGMGLMWINGA